MLENDDIEEGEIIEISDTEATLPSFDSDFDEHHGIRRATGSDFRKSDVKGKRRSENAQYDLDDYELLVARQSLLKQQLDSYNANQKKNTLSNNLNGSNVAEEDQAIEQLRNALLEQKFKRNNNSGGKTGNENNTVQNLNKDMNFNKSNKPKFSNQNNPMILLKPISNPYSGQGSFMPYYTDDTNDSQNSTKATRRSSRINKPRKEQHLTSPSSNTRSKSIVDLTVGIANQEEGKNRKTRRGKRGGKRVGRKSKTRKKPNEAYAKEVNFLRQQHAVVYDNYTNVPMDIDDDDSLSVGSAPLPLIETPEIRPPLPPPTPMDVFRPAFDHAASQMAHSNVAWMPGFVESLDKPKSNDNLIPETSGVIAKSESVNEKLQVHKDDKDGVGVDDSEVWALRAQALKSLACKRASKVKQEVKVKTQAIRQTDLLDKTNEKQTQVLYDATSIKFTSAVLSPSPSGASTPTSLNELQQTQPGYFRTFKDTPKHPPVIIQLTSDDFSSDNDDVITNSKISSKKIQEKQQLKAGIKRGSYSDEHLLKELQANTERSNVKLKKISSYITRDQLQYKKLQALLAEKKSQFTKESDEVKQLHEKLKEAIKKRTETKKQHNNIFSELKDLRENLSEKLSLRNMLSEDILRARSMVSASRAKSKSGLDEKFRDQISSLTLSMIDANQKLTPFIETVVPKSQVAPLANVMGIGQETDTSMESQVDDATELSTKIVPNETIKEVESITTQQTNQKDIKKQSDNDSSVQPLFDSKSLEHLKNSKIQENQPEAFIEQGLLEYLKSSSQRKNIIPFNIIGNKKMKDSFQQNDKKLREIPSERSYKSPLLRFRSYRLSPYFRMQNKLSLLSPSFSNKIPPRGTWCRFDINGSCNDEKCKFWHFKKICELNTQDIISNLLSYDTHVFKGEKVADDEKRKTLVNFVTDFEKQFSAKISPDDRILLIWNQLKESRKKKGLPGHECIYLGSRKWFQDKKMSPPLKEKSVHFSTKDIYHLKKKSTNKVQELEEDDQQQVRYFSESYDAINVLETAIEDDPNDTKLWLSLAKLHLNKKINKDDENVEDTRMESALSVLSRALEQNQDCEELWIHYLKLFSKNSTAEDLRELSYQAVMYAATYNVWWTCLELETSFRGKNEIFSEIIKFLVEEDMLFENRSHCLLETLLCFSRIVTFQGKVQLACAIITAALGGKPVNEEKLKIHVTDFSKHLTVADKAILWISSISVHVFAQVPNCLFAPENYGTSRLVCKEKFLLDWKKIPQEMTHSQVRRLFKAAFDDLGRKSKDIIRNSILLLENYVAFQLWCNNTNEAVSQLRDVTKNDPSFVEGHVLLFSVYIQHSSVDNIVTVAEDFVHRCEHDIEFVYHYATWLFSQGMPTLAMEKLGKAILVYFEMEQSDGTPDVLFLYKKVLGLPLPYNIGLKTYLPHMKTSQHLLYYYWMSYCLLLKLKKVKPSARNMSATDEAFESAVHQYTSTETSKKLWMGYLEHRLQVLMKYESIPRQLYDDFIELLFRCLISVPALSVISNNQNVHWRNYTFHNKLFSRCLQVIPVSEHAQIYRRTMLCMPDNIELAIKVCEFEIKDGNFEQARVISAFILQDFPTCLPLWQMAVGIELKCNCIREARWLYEEALKNLPFCEILWKDFCKFEIDNAANINDLNEKLASMCSSADKQGIDMKNVLQKLKNT